MNLQNISLKTSIIIKAIMELHNWHTPILRYFSTRKKEDIIRFKNGTKCIIRDKSDAIAFFEIFFLKVNTNAENFSIKEKDVIVDIGAHVGYFTIYAAKQAPKGKIYSFEPSGDSFNTLQKNIKLNKFDNAIAENCGILKKSGNAVLYVDENHAIGNSMFRNDSSLRKEIVNTVSLEDIFDKYQIQKIDLLKMDCEGAEYEILLNLPSTILKKIAKISAEVHSGIENYTVEDLSYFLKANNFQVEYKTILSESQHLLQLYAINKSMN